MSEYPYPFFDEKGKLICQICGKSFLVITPRHLQLHNIKYDAYTKRFPEAPLSSKEFIARGKYGKVKDIFKDDEIGAEQLVDEVDPEVEELAIEKLSQSARPRTPMDMMKNKILDHLRLYFSNVKKDYLITQCFPDGRLKFEFITDFCDPILKIVIQFPDTFWHNREASIDINKNTKLAQSGWKVIEVPTNNPQIHIIDEYLSDII